MSSLHELLGRLGIELPAEVVATLARYRDLLLDANRLVNLTAVSDPADVDARLIAESLMLLPLVPADATTLLDVGTGGGIPGIPIAIARPDLSVALLDATGKKVRFLEDVARELALSNISTLWGRAEEIGHDPAHRERYDLVTARAVARLATLAEYTLPFARVGGLVLLPKGSGIAEELDQARHAISLLGGDARPLLASTRDGSVTVAIDKPRPTPPAYPRRTGLPAKSPLLLRTHRPYVHLDQNAR